MGETYLDKKDFLISTSLFLLVSSIVNAHPGRTDSSGGHTCRTNCEKWGLSYGEYHYHNGGSSSSSTSSSASYEYVDTRSEEEKEADEYIWQGNYYYKQSSYYNALYYYLKAKATAFGWKVDYFYYTIAAQKLADQAIVNMNKDNLAAAKQYFVLLEQDTLLAYTYNVSSNMEWITERQAFLNAFGDARWYYSQKNYINAVLLADQKMNLGLANNSHAINFINDSALKLSQQAYGAFLKTDYDLSLKCYTVLANSNYAPKKLKDGAAVNVKVVQGYLQ